MMVTNSHRLKAKDTTSVFLYYGQSEALLEGACSIAALKISTNIHSDQRINPNDFDDL